MTSIARFHQSLKELAAPSSETLPGWEEMLCWHDRWFGSSEATADTDELAGGEPAYWRCHSRFVAQLMAVLARWLGEDEALFRAAGMLHDLDALRHPPPPVGHAATAMEPYHPVPAVRWLARKALPAELLLAILEHAPHTGLASSGGLTDALIFCDDYAAFYSAGKVFPTSRSGWPPGFLSELRKEARREPRVPGSSGSPTGSWAQASETAMRERLAEASSQPDRHGGSRGAPSSRSH